MASDKIKFFDSHLHIIDPCFPVYENQGFIPKPFTVEDYISHLEGYDLAGGAIVSGSFQKQDQTYLLDALDKLGPNYVGVTQLLANTPDSTILYLNQTGVRGVRFNLKRGGSEDISKIKSFASRIYELANWHVELYIDSSQLDSLYSTLISLPRVSIDHLGLSKAGFHILLKLAEKDIKIKATGFGRIDFDSAWAVARIFEVNPDCLMFGTDLPSTRAVRPYKNTDITLIIDAVGETNSTKILFSNAHDFYIQRHRRT